MFVSVSEKEINQRQLLSLPTTWNNNVYYFYGWMRWKRLKSILMHICIVIIDLISMIISICFAYFFYFHIDQFYFSVRVFLFVNLFLLIKWFDWLVLITAKNFFFSHQWNACGGLIEWLKTISLNTVKYLHSQSKIFHFTSSFISLKVSLILIIFFFFHFCYYYIKKLSQKYLCVCVCHVCVMFISTSSLSV